MQKRIFLKEESLNKKTKRLDYLIFITIVFMLAIIPVFVRMHYSYSPSPLLTNSGLAAGDKFDLFVYYKFYLLMVGTALCFIFFLLKIFVYSFDLIELRMNYLVFSLLLLLPLSAFFSPMKSIALMGYVNRNEGVIAYICYLLLFLILMNISLSASQIVVLFFSVTPFVLINSLMGIYFTYGRNLLKEEFVLKLINVNDIEFMNSLIHSKSYYGMTTISNQNYSSTVACVLLILFLSLMLLHKNFFVKLMSFILALASFVIIVTSVSQTGFLGFYLFTPFVLLFAFLRTKESWMKNLVFTILFFLFASSCFHILCKQNPRVWSEAMGIFTDKNPYLFSDNLSNVSNENDNVLPMIVKDQEPLFLASKDGELAETHNFDNYQLPTLPQRSVTAGSGRLFIWQKVIETWKKRPIFGHGMDTFPLVVDNDDVRIVSGLGSYSIHIINTHSMYLALLYGGGIITFSIFMTLFLSLSWHFLRNLFSKNCDWIIFVSGFAMMTFLVINSLNETKMGGTVICWILMGVFANRVVQGRVSKVRG